MIALLRRDLAQALRSGGGFGLSLAFFLIVVMFVPFGIGPDRATLAGIVPLHMDTQMPSWNVAVISRSAHTLSPLCRNFLAEIKKTAAAFS